MLHKATIHVSIYNNICFAQVSFYILYLQGTSDKLLYFSKFWKIQEVEISPIIFKLGALYLISILLLSKSFHLGKFMHLLMFLAAIYIAYKKSYNTNGQ